MSKSRKSENDGRSYRDKKLGDFRLLKKLGSGTMGVVYLAEQLSRNRPAAVKVLFPHQARKPGYKERFYREAGMMSRLHHPNIVCCYRAGREKGHCYFGMEHVEGFPLSRFAGQDGPRLPIGNVLYVITKCAEALQHAHEHQVVHRDVKPGNVMITYQGQVKITDMGLAKLVNDELGLTGSGVGMGTPLYVAPEQARNAKQVDRRADVYSLGVMLYKLLTGEAPFMGDGPVQLVLAKEQAFFVPASRLNPEVPKKLDDVLRRMLKPNPMHRFESCEELLDALALVGLERVPLNLPELGIAAPPKVVPHPSSRTSSDVLLVHRHGGDVKFAEKALQRRKIEGRLHVVEDGRQGILFLKRFGAYARSPRPELVVLTTPFAKTGMRQLLTLLQESKKLQGIPVLVIPSTATARAILRAHGISSHQPRTTPADVKQLECLLTNT